MIFDEKSIHGKWYDAVDDMIDHNRHVSEDIGSVKWWTYRISTEIVPCTFMFQVRMRLTLPGPVSELDYYGGSVSRMDELCAMIPYLHEDIAIHMAEYTDTQIQERGHH